MESRVTNSNYDLSWIRIFTQEFEFPVLVDFGGVAIQVEAVIQGGEDAHDALSWYVISRQRAL